jgi:rare lipoprotein A
MVWVSWIAASRGLAVSQRGGRDHNKATSRPGTDPDLAGLTIGRRIRPPVRRSLSGSFMSFVSQAVPGGRALGQPAVIALTLCASACAPARLHTSAALPETASLPPPPAPALKPEEKPLFSQIGTASWYRPKLQKRTASGEAFDGRALTAAHRSLPFGTIVRVTCLKTGRMVKLRINDRGPFAYGRVLDVSAAAADVLGMKQDGASNVLIEEFASDQT